MTGNTEVFVVLGIDESAGDALIESEIEAPGKYRSHRHGRAL
ncbi:hypothetical protein [Antrihabitans cavernicola]|nr:hypothetical protein [Spelaeibacter cavernicola]